MIKIIGKSTLLVLSLGLMGLLLFTAYKKSRNTVRITQGSTRFYISDSTNIIQLDSNTVQFTDNRGKFITIKGDYVTEKTNNK